MKAKFTNGNFVFVDEKAYKYLYRVNLDKDSIVLPNIGANCGEVYYVAPTDLPYQKNVLGPNAILVRSSNNDNKFLFYLLSAPTCQKDINLLIGSSGQPKYNKTDLAHMFIYVPQSKTEQTKIGDLLSKVDNIIEQVKRKATTLKKYKEGLIDFEIKNGIEIGKLSDVVKVEDKTSLQSNLGKEFGKYPFFINNSDETSKYTDNYIFDGKYVIANTGGEAYIRYYDGKFSAMSDCLVLRPIKNPVGIYYYLKSIQSITNRRGFQGTGLKHLDQDWFFEQKVKIPKMSEEELEKLESLFNRYFDILKIKSSLLAQLKQYCQKGMFI